MEVHAGKILEQTVDVKRILKAFLEGSQIEMRGRLLKTGEKVILATKWQRTWLNSGLVVCGK